MNNLAGHLARRALGRLRGLAGRGGAQFRVQHRHAARLAALAGDRLHRRGVQAAVDDELNDHAYIVPGLGDAGDRAYGTK